MSYDPASISRRSLLLGSATLLMPKLLWSEHRDGPLLYWKLEGAGDSAKETVSGADDPISFRPGNDLWVGEGKNRALRLDGYSVWVDHSASKLPAIGGTFTIAAWLALESYPVNEAAILETKSATETLSFSVDKLGYLRFGRSGASSEACESGSPLPKAKWIHLAMTVSDSGKTILYCDGVQCGSSITSARTPLTGSVDVTLAKSSDSAIEAKTFPTGVLNGLIKDVRIYGAELSSGSIQQLLEEAKPDSAPDLQINKVWFPNDPQRPIYHAMPPRAWTNEPHGLIYWRGEYHLFYQKNPNGPYWGHLNWGHMTSPDLLRWTEMPVAIWPERGLDSEGCWSGSVIEHDGKLALIYTAVDGKKACICAAFSDDGVHFEKYKGNPLIAGTPEGFNYQDFRDPHIWRERDGYRMIVGSGVNDVGGTALLFRSDDFFTWHYLKPLMVGSKENSGTFWEMPIFVKLGDQHVLIVCEVPGRSSYWVGTWKDDVFQPKSIEPTRLELFNQYLSPTPCATKDGRMVTIGIIPEMRGPRDQWLAGWSNLYGLPRILALDGDDRLIQTPLREIEQLATPIYSGGSIQINPTAPHVFTEIAGPGLEIELTFARNASTSVTAAFRRSPDGREETVLRYEWASRTLTLDRSRSSLNTVSRHAVQSASYEPIKPGRLDLRVFLDNSVLEVFVDGRDTFTSRMYPTLKESVGVAVACEGGSATLETVGASRMRAPSRNASDNPGRDRIV